MAKKIYTDLPYFIDSSSITQLIARIEENEEDAEISWNSFGGSVYAGQQFADFLNNEDMKLEANVTGIAASMGAALLPFFNRVKGSEQSDIMLHSAGGGGGASMKHTNQFLYEALAKKINEEAFEKITGHKLKTVMLAEGENKIDVWFTGKDAKKMGLFDEVYNLIDPKSNNLSLPIDNLGYDLPETVKNKYAKINKIITMEVKDLTASKLQAENPELYNSIIAATKTAEQKRVADIMKYAKFDFEKATEMIKSGAELQIADVEHFVEKKFNLEKVESLENGSAVDLKPAKVTASQEVVEKEEALKEFRESVGLDFTPKK